MVQERSDRIPLLMYLVTTLIITLSLFSLMKVFTPSDGCKVGAIGLSSSFMEALSMQDIWLFF
ncbi:MAG: hypothetical protein IPF67_15975 [Saprospiraceae bacterium]|nr:hypothetical protein [Candidatus Brachybacter algidus]